MQPLLKTRISRFNLKIFRMGLFILGNSVVYLSFIVVAILPANYLVPFGFRLNDLPGNK